MAAGEFIVLTVKGNMAEFRFYRPGAKNVELVGDFNDWRRGELRMQPMSDGYWCARLKLPAGTFKFRYNVDGQWFADFAAFGIEYGPFGPDSLVHIAHKAHSGAVVLLHPERDSDLRVA